MKRIFILSLLLVISVASFASETIKSFDVKLKHGNFISTQKVVLNNNHASFSFIGRMYDIDVMQSDPSDQMKAFARISVQMIISSQTFKTDSDVIEVPDVDEFFTRVSFTNKNPARIDAFGVNAEFTPLY